MITLYALPSILALALKLTIFWFGRHSLVSASIYLWFFFIGLFGINLIELIGFFYAHQPEKGLLWLSLYYVFAEITALSLLALALENTGKLNKYFKVSLVIVLLLGSIPLIVPGAALSGATSIGYSVTRITGPYYFLVQLSILLPLVSSLLVSAYFSMKSEERSMRRKSQILLIACSPSIFTVITVMILMQMGFVLNAAIILSFAIIITLLVLVYTEHKERQYQFMSMIPKTREYDFVKQLSLLIIDPRIGLEQGRQLIEQEMIREALVLSGGSKVKAASLLGVSRQTLQRKLVKESPET